MNNKKKQPINLILGPGGARGYVHVGVIKELLKENFEIKSIIGISMGAVVGWAYAFSGDIAISEDLASRFNTQYKKYIKNSKSMLQLDVKGLKECLMDLSNGKDYQFSELKVPLYVVVTNIATGKIEFIHKGSVIDAIIASSLYPFINRPFRINDAYYLDGGIIEGKIVKIPKTIKDQDPYIAIDIYSMYSSGLVSQIKSVLLRHAFMLYYRKELKQIKKNKAVEEVMEEIDQMIRINVVLNHIKKHEFHRAKECFEYGKKLINENMHLIQKFTS